MIIRLTLLSSIVVLFSSNTLLLAQETAVTVFQFTSPSVVRLHNAASAGTGVVLNNDGLILTNAHVIGSPLPFRCTCEVMKDGKRQTVVFEKVKILKTHKELDLALVQIDPKEHRATLAPCQLAKYKGITGQRVYAIGNPGTDSEVSLNKTITEGLLSGVDREVDGDTYYQISAAINPGNSGGPLCDSKGAVIGIVTLKLTDVDNVGFALPVYDIKMEDFHPYTRKTIDAAKARELLAKAGPIIEQVRLVRQKVSAARTEVGQEIVLPLKSEIMLVVGMQMAQAAAYYDPNNIEVFILLGNVFFNASEYPSAEPYFKEAIRMNPWCGSGAYELLGKSLGQQDRDSDANIIYIEGVLKYPANAALWQMVHYKYYHKKDYVEGSLCSLYQIYISTQITKKPDMVASGKRSFQRCYKFFTPAQKNDLPTDKQIRDHLVGIVNKAKELRSSGYNAITPAFGRWMEKETGTKIRTSNKRYSVLPK
ncbi:MAG: hypothetical protein COA78_20065 [Blastopirellula sp.]|nr:MAG: hypothetical protein COA78_20065 [Blastopirellula sp.]